MNKIILLFFLSLTNFAFVFSSLSNQAWDQLRFQNLAQDQQYQVNIGSGFFINDDTIITNRHVVTNCLNIAVRGAVLPQIAKLHVVDYGVDLATIKIDQPDFGNKFIYFRDNFLSISHSDLIFSVGYPLQSGNTGHFIVEQATVNTLKSYADTQFTQIEFNDLAHQGNSGGPLLDKNSNLVGIVTAKLTYNATAPGMPSKIVSMAIGIDGIIAFLDHNNIPYFKRPTHNILINYAIKDIVKSYMVNIHCIQEFDESAKYIDQ